MPKIGLVFRSYMRDAERRVPIVIEWDRSNNTHLIDKAASRRTRDAGATDIAHIRGAVMSRLRTTDEAPEFGLFRPRPPVFHPQQ